MPATTASVSGTDTLAVAAGAWPWWVAGAGNVSGDWNPALAAFEGAGSCWLAACTSGETALDRCGLGGR